MWKQGRNTDTIVYKKNGNEIHHSFIVGQSRINTGTSETPIWTVADMTITEGMPVGLTEDGKVVLLNPLDTNILPGASNTISPSYIGVALMTRKTGEQITICVRGRIVVRGLANNDLDAGPVIVTGNSESLLQPDLRVPAFDAPTSTPTNENQFIGWALAPAESGEPVIVLYRH